MDVGKRNFFRNIVRHAYKSDSVSRNVPRPPTALEEKKFIQTCTGCGECVSACPNGIIVVKNELAELDLELSYCSHCHQCNEVCPTAALSHSVSDCQLRPTITSNCNPQTAFYCAECQHGCPVGAITVQKNNKPAIDLGLCNGCNSCRYHCPVNAITTSILN
ncbi:4Fe-4S binding protein [Vibrio ziniensis]|uniref:4Fe-4S binding protein n=1 Tax=Vibrio ziniensis TaxID=2711221 RepID=A0A6G7CR73_9VIBR|nr:4Fe-4S binding protein [Vibrio ziniensis]